MSTTSTMDNQGGLSQNRHLSNQHFLNPPQCLSIDGPNGKLTSALQVVTEALSSTESGPNHAIQNHSTQIPNVISLAHNLTIAHSATSSKSNSLGLVSNLHSDDQSSIAQECQNTILINHATHRPQLSSPYERSSTIDAPQPANTFTSSSTFSSLNANRVPNGAEVITSQGIITTATGKTITSPDSDVSNGFVKDGKMLPYVFEANEAGVRKRTSKILPVCGVCGKRFVCVTTMKRHLVTHTGEKPFCCKVCGKQYTQKGNLRVHERTHRNDRPFECNICHQKFYRKEPMQKHQWRQHGIVHFKSRPIHSSTESSLNNIDQTSTNSAIIDNNPEDELSLTSNQNPTVVVKRENHQNDQFSVDSNSLQFTSKYDDNVDTSLPYVNCSGPSDFSIPYPKPPEAHRSSSCNDRERSLSPIYKQHRESISQLGQQNDARNISLPRQPPQAHSNNLKMASDLSDNRSRSRKESLSICVNLSSTTSEYGTEKTTQDSLSSLVPKPLSGITISSVVPLKTNGEFMNAKQEREPNFNHTFEESSSKVLYTSSSFQHPQEPSKIRLEAKPSSSLQQMGSNTPAGLVDANGRQPIMQQISQVGPALSSKLSNMSKETSNVVVVLPQIPEPDQKLNTQNNENNEDSTPSGLQQAPLKLKMKFAQAYQKEVQEQRDRERQRDEEDSRQLGGTCSGVQQIIINSLDKMELKDVQLSNTSSPVTRESSPSSSRGFTEKVVAESLQTQPKEMVECQCKSCGCTFVVHDPYNFRCDNCNMKYTSMPTHLIADPLQCIGCCQVFPHKPALKAHQMSPQASNMEGPMANAPSNDSKERPFRCCKCGYGFRQKAHLQKHQWRIHRRRIEPMDQQPIKEAEAFFHAIKSSKALSIKPSVSEPGVSKPNDPDVTTVTTQDIINHAVEHSLRSTRPFPGKNTTSSKYFSDVLGLEFEGSNMSSNQDDIDNEGMDDDTKAGASAIYEMDHKDGSNVHMQDACSDQVIDAKRPLHQKKQVESSQPLDLSPMKKGMAIDYSNSSKINVGNISTNCDDNINRSCQSSTTHPPKITLRLRDFAYADIPSSHENYSQDSNLTQIPRNHQSQEGISNTLHSPQNMVTRSPIDTDQKINNASITSAIHVNQREDNPLLNQRPLPTTAHMSFIKTSPTASSNAGQVPTPSMAPAWKKARTSSPSRPGLSEPYSPTVTSHLINNDLEPVRGVDATVSTHRTLPPITNLQKPMSLVRKLLPTATTLSLSKPNNGVINGTGLSSPAGQGNLMQNGSLNLQIAGRSTQQLKNIPLQSVLQTQTKSSEQNSIPFPNLASKSGNSEFVRDKLLQLASQNVRTV